MTLIKLFPCLSLLHRTNISRTKLTHTAQKHSSYNTANVNITGEARNSYTRCNQCTSISLVQRVLREDGEGME